MSVLEIPLCLRWTVDTRGKPSFNQPFHSAAFKFRDCSEWRLSYCYDATGHVLNLEKSPAEPTAPFNVTVHLESGGMGQIVPELSVKKNYMEGDPDFSVSEDEEFCLWDIWSAMDVGQRLSDFYRDGLLRFMVIVADRHVAARTVASAASQTECSIPEEFEVSCMESLSSDFGQLMVRDLNPDVVFKCAGQSIRAHGAVVCARSSVIACMLGSDMTEGRSRVVKIPNLELDIFKQLLGYIYTGKLDKLTFRTALSLYEVGDQYAVHGLVRRCSRYLVEHLTDQNFCEVLVIADSHSDEVFVKEVIDWVRRFRR